MSQVFDQNETAYFDRNERAYFDRNEAVYGQGVKTDGKCLKWNRY